MESVLHARPPAHVSLYVTRFPALAALLLASSLAAADSLPLPALLKAVENRYNHAQSLQLAFTQTYSGGRRPVQSESGTLYLRKPGRMRWDYASPAGKLFLADGKNVFEYTPGDDQAFKRQLAASDDLRAPLAFLLGHLEFAKEFRGVRSRTANNAIWIEADAKTDNLAYTKAEFQVEPSGEIRRVVITGQDLSKLDFAFSGEKLNPQVAADLFVFHAPRGVEVMEEKGR